jgi:hypothetical protein
MMPHEDQFALRTWTSQVQRATDIAKAMSRLPRYGLLGITKTAVLRLALVDGIEVIEEADPQYFRQKEAQRLLDAIEGGQVTSAGLRLPVINSYNVMLTPEAYADALLAQGIIDLYGGSTGDGKEALVNIRLPTALRHRMDKAVTKMLKAQVSPTIDTTSGAIRLMLAIGLFWMEYKVYWKERRREGRLRDAPTALP